MIKDCNVILHNEKVAVIIFDKKRIQVPSSNLIGKTAYVRFENNKYEVVSKSEFEKESTEKTKRKFLKNKDVGIKEDLEIKSDGIVIDNEE